MFKNNKKYQWFLIDYGNMQHDKFIESELDKEMKHRARYNQDLITFIKNCIFYYLKYLKEK